MRILLLTLFLAVSVSAQEKAPTTGQLPVQGPPPKNLTKLPDGHFSANTDPKNVENFEIRVVVAGDTLSGIALEMLKDARLWPQIWEQNEHIVNPHWIYPNDKILIRPVTRITDAKPPDAPADAPAPAPAPAAPADEPKVVREQRPFIVPPYPATEPPRGPQVILDLTPPRVYPEVKAADLYCSGFIRNADDVPQNIDVVARYNNDEVMAGPGDYVYLGQGQAMGVKPGIPFQVIRPTKTLRGLGTHYLEIAQLEIVLAQQDFALARVSQACEAVELGDFVIPYNKEDFPALPAKRPFSGTMTPSGQIPGKIVASKTLLTNSGSEFAGNSSIPSVTGRLGKLNSGVAGESNVVYLDVGKNDGVKIGDFFIVFREVVPIRGSRLRDDAGNPVRTAVGELVILKVEDRASTALVTYTTDMLSQEDSVERR